MSANPPATHSTAAVELKSGSITLPILKVHTSDLAEVDLQLAQKLGKAPEFFRHAPIIVDLGDLSASQKLELDFIALLGMLQEHALVPVGMRGGTADQQKAAQAEKIAVLAEVRAEPAPAAEAKAPERRRVPPPPRPAAASTKVIDQPVRSGQRVYASGGDLIVLAQVSPGAEIMADGNIHVYGPLRGRAMAGMKGDTSARIFCQDLQAELLSVAGHYRISENIPDEVKGVPVQIFLDGDVLRVEKI